LRFLWLADASGGQAEDEEDRAKRDYEEESHYSILKLGVPTCALEPLLFSLDTRHDGNSSWLREPVAS
jgi:hypothetical protein